MDRFIFKEETLITLQACNVRMSYV